MHPKGTCILLGALFWVPCKAGRCPWCSLGWRSTCKNVLTELADGGTATGEGLVMHERSYLFAVDNPLQVAHCIHVEHVDGQVVFLAHADGCEVHHLEAALQHLRS